MDSDTEAKKSKDLNRKGGTAPDKRKKTERLDSEKSEEIVEPVHHEPKEYEKKTFDGDELIGRSAAGDTILDEG